ncbi:MAG: tRNA (adenosine(37)-N6)-dimethylallyltransferase MiaA [bacterium]|nr:tRNA (adenosine(37)-N6)-dimethylallyltransferase MiaA [bacterium]
MAVVGPTASAKSEVAMGLAERMGAEIISVDSMQVYRGMDIGVAKPSKEMQALVRHHLIDLVEPHENFTVAEFQGRARRLIASSTVPLIVCGGSGLHFRAVVDPYSFPPHHPRIRSALDRLAPAVARSRLLEADPDAGSHLDLHNHRRVARALEVLSLSGRTPSQQAEESRRLQVQGYEPLIPFRAVGLDPGEHVGARVADRLAVMRREGLLEEVAGLAGRMGATASQAVGYRQLLAVVRGEITEEEGFRKTERATLGLVKRQRTFFRRDPRIRWLPWSQDPDERLAMAWEAFSGVVT